MKKYLLFLFAIFQISSCCKKKEEYINLTPETLEWNSYNENDTIIFINTQGKTDTFYVDTIKRYYMGSPENATPGEKDCYRRYYEYMAIQIKKKSGTNESNASVFLVSSTNTITLQWGNFPNSDSGRFFAVQPPDLNNIIINGTTYNNVYLISCESCNIADTVIEKFYYSKEYGFLRYDYKSGEYWEFLK